MFVRSPFVAAQLNRQLIRTIKHALIVPSGRQLIRTNKRVAQQHPKGAQQLKPASSSRPRSGAGAVWHPILILVGLFLLRFMLLFLPPLVPSEQELKPSGAMFKMSRMPFLPKGEWHPKHLKRRIRAPSRFAPIRFRERKRRNHSRPEGFISYSEGIRGTREVVRINCLLSGASRPIGTLLVQLERSSTQNALPSSWAALGRR